MKNFDKTIEKYLNEQQTINVQPGQLTRTNIPINKTTEDTGEVLRNVADLFQDTKATPKTPDEILKTLMSALKVDSPDKLSDVLNSVGYSKKQIENNETQENKITTTSQSNTPKSSDTYASSAPKA